MNMDLDAATKEAPTLTLDPFAEAKAEIVEKKPEELVEEQAVPEMELTPEEQKQVDDFAAVAAVSPSVWFPGWRAYADQHALRSRVVYLSLGDREEKSRNPVLASVGDAIRREDARLSERGVRHTLQWNVGNHFQDAEKRCADGFAWCMAQRKAEGKKTHEHETV